MRPGRMNSCVKCANASTKSVKGHRRNCVGRANERRNLQCRQPTNRSHRLRTVDKSETFLRLQLEWRYSSDSHYFRSRRANAFVVNFSFTNETKGQMSQRGQI